MHSYNASICAYCIVIYMENRDFSNRFNILNIIFGCFR
uniref:Phosphatase A n=1 Tax=Siphoviridae sp. ctEJG5 TaxID=2827814 RepID=A0A8S5RXS7_9CAUD|nr:MAG TPA: phosphatase A [Siphoviridae sp. ctEJG5]